MADDKSVSRLGRGDLYYPNHPAHWERCSLYTMARWVNGLPFRNIQFSSSGLPVIKIAEIKGGLSGQTRYTQQTFDEAVYIRSGDLLFSWSGQPETSIDAFWWRGPDGWLNQHIFRVTPRNDIDRGFFYYLLRYLKTNFVGIARNKQTTGLGHVTKRDLEDIEAAYPPLAEQRAIADVLGALDDKIEQNQQTAQALERLARAIFRAWFVEFEPVKAKAAGAASFPSMPQHVFDSLPTGFVDSEIGPVPEGWEVKAINECISLTMGQSPPSDFYNERGEGLPFHQGVTDYGFRFPTHRVYCTTEGRIAEPLDVLLSVRAPVGRINVADRQLVLGRGLAGLRHLSNRQSFLLQQLCHVFAEEDAVGDGTIYKAVTKRFLEQMLILSPSEQVQDAFENLIRPFDDFVASSEAETRKLAEIRDLLLPKLLLGDVRVDISRSEIRT